MARLQSVIPMNTTDDEQDEEVLIDLPALRPKSDGYEGLPDVEVCDGPDAQPFEDLCAKTDVDGNDDLLALEKAVLDLLAMSHKPRSDWFCCNEIRVFLQSCVLACYRSRRPGEFAGQ